MSRVKTLGGAAVTGSRMRARPRLRAILEVHRVYSF